LVSDQNPQALMSCGVQIRARGPTKIEWLLGSHHCSLRRGVWTSVPRAAHGIMV
jgi:hypothetical protein